jgi:hypothetical protein
MIGSRKCKDELSWHLKCLIDFDLCVESEFKLIALTFCYWR